MASPSLVLQRFQNLLNLEMVAAAAGYRLGWSGIGHRWTAAHALEDMDKPDAWYNNKNCFVRKPCPFFESVTTAGNVLLGIAREAVLVVAHQGTVTTFTNELGMREFLQEHSELDSIPWPPTKWLAPTNYRALSETLARRTDARLAALRVLCHLQAIEDASLGEIRFFEERLSDVVSMELRSVDDLPDAYEFLESLAPAIESETIVEFLRRCVACQWAKNARLGERPLTLEYLECVIRANLELDSPDWKSALAPEALDRDVDLVAKVHSTSLAKEMLRRRWTEAQKASIVEIALLLPTNKDV